ncbi:hypothetical protein GCM10011342_29500 [Aquisalinus flavus]|uniref:Calpastatin n=1 Tax=Aquisalinus flavus TaxID=1526572 RepID=A0A8J2V6J0_9PROT|nr:DUF1810 domain-containing protein [Aquisalinus flavus]MBD0428070.1 DUF1810 domain-containing protein [Aquisalinus flavus]GGD18889.1 hypothetical protein GCM10011342_29500 [Aquisalinus flavus]
MSDPFDLQRFVEAQKGFYDEALRELCAGRKRSHWIWFIFPQVDGLGNSPTAIHYALSGRDEATAYAAHPILGPRLIACTEATVAIDSSDAAAVFGHPDDLKFRSSMTLFEAATGNDLFGKALEKFYDGEPDGETLKRL